MGVAVLSFLAFAASQVGTPGPANMALMATGARFGFRASLPFVAGVALGKQLIIWPIGFGILSLAEAAPWAFQVLKFASIAYIFWLAWKVANLRLGAAAPDQRAPGFLAGLWVHPLNPKAWAMILTGFTSFMSMDTPTLQATATIAICLLACQLVFHPMWALGGDRIARAVAGTPAERYLMWLLAGLTVDSVLVALLGGESR
ncbi:MAG: LysE family translocator [Cognatishimia sp.]|uniref:LysE family translocator n=1 Tax=Cognatishimia sp. TaxID=2211648 RepID=UPI00405A0AF6